MFRIDLMGLLKPLSEYSLEKILDRAIVDQIRQSKDEMKLEI